MHKKKFNLYENGHERKPILGPKTENKNIHQTIVDAAYK